MPHGIREAGGWVLSFAVLLAVLFVVDGWTRQRLTQWGGDVLSVRWSDRVSALGDAMVDVWRGQGIDGVLLATFLVVAVLLVWRMVRS